MIYHLAGFLAGFILDLLLGDPYSLPHPIRWIGTLISYMDKRFLGTREHPLVLSDIQKRRRGRWLVAIVCLLTVFCVVVVLLGAYLIHPVLGCVIEAVMTYQMLACKCLKDESMKVYDRLVNGTLEEARVAVSMIVGRDTDNLDAQQVARAAVETVAENTSDGVIAPMLYLAIGGPVLGFLYKAINTMDSMVGYKNDRYTDFGRFAARLDDVVNFIPSRISGCLIVMACLFAGKQFDCSNAFRIFRRDRFNHASPNSAQTEAACAGALHLRLAGDTSYFGKVVKKPFIGDDDREIEFEDIKRANKLLYITALLCQAICLLVMAIIVIF